MQRTALSPRSGPDTTSAARFESGGGADGIRRRGIGDEPASRLGIRVDGVDPWNTVHQGEVVENGESVEGSVEAVAEWVVERARALAG